MQAGCGLLAAGASLRSQGSTHSACVSSMRFWFDKTFEQDDSWQEASKLNVAQQHRFAQGSQRVPFRHELVRNISLEPQIGDRLRDRPPIQFLRVVYLISPRIAAGVEMGDVLNVLADGADD